MPSERRGLGAEEGCRAHADIEKGEGDQKQDYQSGELATVAKNGRLARIKTGHDDQRLRGADGAPTSARGRSVFMAARKGGVRQTADTSTRLRIFMALSSITDINPAGFHLTARKPACAFLCLKADLDRAAKKCRLFRRVASLIGGVGTVAARARLAGRIQRSSPCRTPIPNARLYRLRLRAFRGVAPS